MESPDKIKSLVKKKYGQIAMAKDPAGCCGGGDCCSGTDYTVFSDDYSKLEGYNREADLGLGCGIPTKHAQLKEGQIVVDLGSGAGNDVFVARRIVGDKGMVIGIDMTEAMIEKARENNLKMGYTNVEFRLGDIESLPVTENTADRVISNCVLNLVPDKSKAFGEIFRVLKPGGHFAISDIVIEGELPEKIKAAAEMYAGCVAGAISKNAYLETINAAGFCDVAVVSEKKIELPDSQLSKYLDAEGLQGFKKSGAAILSVTVVGNKPLGTD